MNNNLILHILTNFQKWVDSRGTGAYSATMDTKTGRGREMEVTYLNVTSLKVGDEFTHRGRTYHLSEPACHTWGWDKDRGEYGRFKAWKTDEYGRSTSETNLTVWEKDC